MINPFSQFSDWLEAAKNCKEIAEPTAMALATVGGDMQPSCRIVLLKAFDEKGFVFYTNLESKKSQQLKQNPKAALTFHWMPLERQVRIEGKIEKVSDKEADNYFATRPRGSQMSAWASKQSHILNSDKEFEEEIKKFEKRFDGKKVPRPEFWSGWRMIPNQIEFWQQGDDRLHERRLYMCGSDSWVVSKLYP